MRSIVITPPAPVVTLDEAKDHCRVKHDSEDDLIEMYVAAATSHIDGPDGWLGRAIGVQALELRLNSFACTDIRLPYPEVISVTSVKYLDSDGVEQTMASDAYEQFGSIVAPVHGSGWPTARYSREAVRIRYQAGYVDVPEALKAAILLMTGDLYSARETVSNGVMRAAVPMSTTVENLLGPYRVYS